MTRQNKRSLCAALSIFIFTGVWTMAAEPKPSSTYLEMRQRALQLTPSDAEAQEGHPVFAAVVDMDMGSAVVTLVCIADGTVSLYFSSGGGQIGLGTDKDTANAGLAFLNSSEQVLDVLKPASDFPLPEERRHKVYLMTEKTVYAQEFEMKTLQTYPKELQFLNFLYQNVLNAIRQARENGEE